MEEGILVRWLKQPGEEVAVGELLFELEGEKALQEVASIDHGILHLPTDAPAPGSTVPVGELLGYLLAPGETPPSGRAGLDPNSHVAQSSAVDKPPKHPAPPPAGPAARRLARQLGVTLDEVPGSGRSGRISHEDIVRVAANDIGKRTMPSAAPDSAAPPVASPRARRVAAELGVDWTRLAGSGRDGRIRDADIRAARGEEFSPQPCHPPGLLTARRKAIGQRLRFSRNATVPVTLTTTADVANLVGLRRQVQAGTARAVPAYTDFAAILAARVLRQHPQLSVRWSEQQDSLVAVADSGIHIGIAVDTTDGLLVPVVRDILRKSLVGIAEETRRLAERARTGRLTAAEMQDAVLTISNLGAYGIDAFTPVINYPEVAIMGLGAVRREPVVHGDDRILVRERMVLSLTFDHAAIDGAPAAAFLADVAAAFANPTAHLLSD
jgi:pyruvate dehydrogenase E2 component (dihydrolipoamide acetyltransferase)